MAEINEELVRERAYFIWEREGRPEGKQTEHWEAALRELALEMNLSGNGEHPASARGKQAASAKPSRKRSIKSIVARAKDAFDGAGASAETAERDQPRRRRSAKTDSAARAPKKP